MRRRPPAWESWARTSKNVSGMPCSASSSSLKTLSTADWARMKAFQASNCWSLRGSGASATAVTLPRDSCEEYHCIYNRCRLEAEYHGWTHSPLGDRRAGFSATTEVDREDFGLTWNVAIEAGGVLVGKKAKLDFEIEA